MTGIYVGLTGIVVAVDQWMKWMIEHSAEKLNQWKSREGMLEIRKVHNKGMMLDFLDSYPNLVKTLSFLATIVVFAYQILLHGKPGRWQEKLGLALVSGGAVSNTLDRVSRGYVVDYIGFRFKWKKLRNITYNIGDFAIFLGVFLTMCGKVFKKK